MSGPNGLCCHLFYLSSPCGIIRLVVLYFVETQAAFVSLIANTGPLYFGDGYA